MVLCAKRYHRRRTSIVTMGWLGLLSITSAWITSPDHTINHRGTIRRMTEEGNHRKTPANRPMFGQALHRNQTISSSTTTVNKKPVPSIIPGLRNPQRTRRTTVEGSIRSDSSIMSLHMERLQNAGRVGTKRFVNPCKVFIGNISFQVQSAHELRVWVTEQMGMSEHILLKDCQLIKEWKTGKSKGYGFVLFTEPIYATMAITKLNGIRWYDRPLTVHQGIQQKTIQELSLLQERATRKRNKTSSIQEDPPMIYMDAQEAAMLKHLDPDLLDGVHIVPEKPNHLLTSTPSDPTLDSDTEYEDEDDDDDGVDGIWYEDDGLEESSSPNRGTDPIENTKNRQQRRDDAKGKKKIKRPRKGFG